MTALLTTSWDDGHILDLRLADLLSRYGFKATFYVAREYATPRLTESQMRDLATRHEIGAHTLTHPQLTQIAPEQARAEITGSRQWLEDVLGQPVTTFCYPRGDTNAQVKALAQAAGFRLARTVQAYSIARPADPMAVATTFQVYPFPRRPIRARNPLRPYQPLWAALPHAVRLRLGPGTLSQWTRVALATLERAIETDGVWHLWGHSWEIEQYDLWHALEECLKMAQHYPGRRVVNSQLLPEQ